MIGGSDGAEQLVRDGPAVHSAEEQEREPAGAGGGHGGQGEPAERQHPGPDPEPAETPVQQPRRDDHLHDARDGLPEGDAGGEVAATGSVPRR